MDTTVRFLLTAIALLAMVNHAPADTGRDAAEVVLEVAEINSSTVEVGAFAVVVYGRRERQPTSGEWAKLDTARGYIKALDQRRLIVGLEPDGWSKWIALERIQALVLVGFPSPDAIARASELATASIKAVTVTVPFQRSGTRDSTQAGSGRAIGQLTEMPKESSVRTDDMGGPKRIAFKLFSGAFAGSVSAFSGAGIGMAIENCPEGGDPDDWCGFGGAVLGGTFGCIAGTALGVSNIDPHDRFFFPLLGSLLGFGTGIWLTASDGELWPSLFVGPAAFATVMSELSRKPPKARRFSVDLVPNPKKGLSAVATLRF